MGRVSPLQLANPEDLLAARGADAFDRGPAVLQFDLLGVLNLPVLLLLVHAVTGYHCDFLAPNEADSLYKHDQNASIRADFGKHE
jgi:hypothetical protein